MPRKLTVLESPDHGMVYLFENVVGFSRRDREDEDGAREIKRAKWGDRIKDV
jgi:hypothetical protein